MRPRSALAVVLATACVLPALLVAPALAQSELDGPAPAAASGPEPLWVPDPQPAPEAADEPATTQVEVTAPVTVASEAAEDPARVAIAHWMAGAAREAGLPGELPVMAGLVESGLRNLPFGHADSVGFFQMRVSVWNSGVYAGYLTRPELQMRWFADHASAVRDAHLAADPGFGEDPAGWGEWIADVERPFEAYRGRYQARLQEARAMLAQPDPGISPFQLGLTVGDPASSVEEPGGEALAKQVLADPEITLDPRATSDLVDGNVDPRVSAVLLAAAARSSIAIWVIQTGHSYYTVNGNVSNHSFGRAVDIGSVGGEVVSPTNDAAHALALAIGRLAPGARPTEIGSPWSIDEPGYFTDAGHQDHLHLGFDDPAGADAAAAALIASEPLEVSAVPVAARRASAPAEPRFDAGGASGDDGGDDPRFEVGG